MAKLAIDIRSVLIPVSGQRQLLLPNATVAEVITYTSPDPFEEAPSWVLGRVTWRGWRVPVVSMAMLGRWADHEDTTSAKIAVLKGLGGNADMPFMAMVTQGFPHLITVNADSLRPVDGSLVSTLEARGTAAEAPGSAGEEDRIEAEATYPPGDDEDDADELGKFSVEMEFADLESQGPDSERHEGPGREEQDEEAGDVGSVSEDGNGAAAGPVEIPDLPEDFDAVAAVVEIEGDQATIPDLLKVEKLVVQTIGREQLRSRT